MERESGIGRLSKDVEGDLLLDEYKESRKKGLGGYYFRLICMIYLVSKLLLRLTSKFDYMILPDGLALFTIIVIIYM